MYSLDKANKLYSEGKLEEALIWYDKAISAYSNCAQAHSSKADALEALGKRQEAMIHYNKAISLEPYYNIKRGFALLRRGDHHDAIECFEKG